ncbi:MAG TPA: AraC family transcriptional regulator [Chitinophagaceae bacterium]|nr:AraC family transcriptional regulator [Chitinophagaceae bacterium]
MQISNHPEQAQDAGAIVPVPKALKDRLASWATITCKEYDFGTVILQQLSAADYSIYIATFQISKPAKLYALRHGAAVVLQYTREGEIIYRLNNQEKMLLETTRYNLFYLTNAITILQPPAGISESLLIEIGADYLKDLLAAHAPLQKMMENLDHADTDNSLLFPAHMNGKVKNIIYEMCQTDKTGHSLHLEMKAQIYRLLSAYDEDVTLTHYLESVQASKTAKTILAVKYYIIEHPHIHDCSLDNLAKRFAISASTLKMNFKKQCDISLGDFVQRSCILKAKELVLLGIDSIRDISLQLGYTDVSNFSRAFRNYMGCSPNEMRMHPEKYGNSV